MTGHQCSTCARELRPGARFCSQCGAPQVSAAAGPVAAPAEPVRPSPPEPAAPVGSDGAAVARPRVVAAPPSEPHAVAAAPPPEPAAAGAASLSGEPRAGFGDLLAEGRRTATTSRFGERINVAPLVIVGLPAIALTFLFVWNVLLGHASVGADSPEAVAHQLADSVDGGDYLSLVNVIAPSENPNIASWLPTLVNRIGDDESTGVDDASGYSVQLDLTRVDVQQENEDVAIVSVEFDASIDGSDLVDTLQGAIDDSGNEGIDIRRGVSSDEIVDALRDEAEEIDEISFVAIREDDRWFISPSLTTIHYLSIVQGPDDLDPDWDAVLDLPSAEADSPGDALDGLFNAIGDRDVEAVASYLDTGTARALMVIADDIQEDIDFNAADNIRVGADFRASGDLVEIEEGSVEFDSTRVDTDRWCGRDGDGELCVNVGWLRSLPETPQLRVSQQRGGVVIDTVQTSAGYLNFAADHVPIRSVVVAADFRTGFGPESLYERWAEEKQLPVGATEVSLGDDWFAFFTTPEVDGPHLVSAGTDFTVVDNFDDTGVLVNEDAEESPLCPYVCDVPPNQTATVRISELLEQTVTAPTRAAAELPPGTGYAFRVEGAGSVAIEITSGSNVSVWAWDEPQNLIYADDLGRSGYCSMPCYAYVVNTGSEAEKFEATFSEEP